MSRLMPNCRVISSRSDRALRGHLSDVCNLSEVTFERLGDTGRHRGGAGAGELCVDDNGWKIDLRHQRHRQFPEPECTGDGDRER